MHLWSFWADAVLFVWELDIPVSLGSNLGGLLFDSGRFVTKITAKVAVCKGRLLWGNAD